MSTSRGGSSLSVANKDMDGVTSPVVIQGGRRPPPSRSAHTPMSSEPSYPVTVSDGDDARRLRPPSPVRRRRGSKKEDKDKDPPRFPNHCCCKHCAKGRAHEMLQTVNVHGFRRLDRSKRCGCRRVLWVIILLVSLLMCCYCVIMRIQYYLTYPTTMRYDLMTSPGLVDSAPSVTLCNQNRFRLSELEKHKWLQPFRLQHAKQLENFTRTSSRDLMTKTAHQMEDMLLSCQFGASNCSHHNFSTHLTPDGVCYTLALQGSSAQETHPGDNTRTLKLLLNVETYDHTPEGSRGSGMSVRLNTLGEFPAGDAAVIPSGTHSIVEAEVTRVRLVAPPYGRCNAMRSTSDCLLHCRTDLVLDQCHCKAFWMPRDYEADSKPFCTASMHFTCVENIVEHSRLASVCDCPPLCDYEVYKPVSKHINLPELDMKSVLPQKMYSKVAMKYETGVNTRERLVPTLKSKTDSLILNFTHALGEVRKSFDKLRGDLTHALAECETMSRQMEMRTNAHDVLGLMGLKKIVENGFIRYWELLEMKTLQGFTSKLIDTVNRLDRTVTQLKTAPSSEQTMRKTLHFLMGGELSADMDLAVEALDNFTKVSEAFLDAEPLSSHIVTPGRNYDNYLVPVEVLTHNTEKQNQLRQEITAMLTEFMENILTLQTELKKVYSTGDLNDSAYESARDFFVAHSDEFNQNIAMFRDKIVYRAREILEHKMLQFKKLNHTMNLAFKDVENSLQSLVDLIDGSYMASETQFVTFAQTAEEYYSDPPYHKKSDVARVGLSQPLSVAFTHFQELMWELVSRGRQLSEIWARLQGSTERVWQSMHDEDSLRRFYIELNQDVTDMVENSMKATHYKKIFLHPKMLDMEEQEVEGMAPETFYHLLNSDIHAQSLEEKFAEFGEFFTDLKTMTGVTPTMQSSARNLYNAYLDIKEDLKDFDKRASFNETFARENVISIELILDNLDVELIVQEVSYPLSQLFGDIATTMLIFLGASIISLLELLDVLITTICFSKKRKRKRPGSDGAEYDDVATRQGEFGMDRRGAPSVDSFDSPYKFHNHMSRSVEV